MSAQDRPDGPLSGLMHDYAQRLRAAGRHSAAEGHSASPRTVLESYDRTLHPWTHGRRPGDLVETFRDWWEGWR